MGEFVEPFLWGVWFSLSEELYDFGNHFPPIIHIFITLPTAVQRLRPRLLLCLLLCLLLNLLLLYLRMLHWLRRTLWLLLRHHRLNLLLYLLLHLLLLHHLPIGHWRRMLHPLHRYRRTLHHLLLYLYHLLLLLLHQGRSRRQGLHLLMLIMRRHDMPIRRCSNTGRQLQEVPRWERRSFPVALPGEQVPLRLVPVLFVPVLIVLVQLALVPGPLVPGPLALEARGVLLQVPRGGWG